MNLFDKLIYNGNYRKIIIMNLFYIIILTSLFSLWRIYSTSSWLKELKLHIEQNTKELKKSHESNIEILLEHTKVIENNQKLILTIKNQNDILLLGIQKNSETILKNQKRYDEIYDEMLENQKIGLEILKKVK